MIHTRQHLHNVTSISKAPILLYQLGGYTSQWRLVGHCNVQRAVAQYSRTGLVLCWPLVLFRTAGLLSPVSQVQQAGGAGSEQG